MFTSHKISRNLNTKGGIIVTGNKNAVKRLSSNIEAELRRQLATVEGDIIMEKRTPIFKTKNKFGRQGCRRRKIRWRTVTGELNRLIAHCKKTFGFKLIKDADQNVLTEASWTDSSKIRELIRKDLPQITVDNIQRVNNPYLAAMYELTKEEYRSRCKSGYYTTYGVLKEQQLFHSTRQDCVSMIVENNLDWRKVSRCRFGRGNCFSRNADYANCHARRWNRENRAFIVCQVLVCNEKCGSSGLEIPPKECDTSVGANGLVCVKYQDNECLPQFVAYYKCDMMRDVHGSKFY